MRPIITSKLKPGDLVRLIAPSQSYAIVRKEQREIAAKRLDQELGLKISFGKYVEEIDEFKSSSVEHRLFDLHTAFADPQVKGVICIEGGFNSNQLLNRIDWNLIKNNPKIFCGYSDITVLNNAIYAKTGLTTYSSPLFSTMGMKKDFDYTLEYFKKCVMQNESYEIKPSEFWSDDDWETDQENRTKERNEGPWLIQKGDVKGKIIGGNLSSLALLQGTDYWPQLTDSILFVEEDYEWQLHHVDRCLTGILQQPDFHNCQGLVIGRFQKESKVTRELLIKLSLSKKELKNKLILANVDFGHTNPKATFPIGGTAKIINDKIKILTH